VTWLVLLSARAVVEGNSGASPVAIEADRL
jgi:hypothetical protein